MKKKEPFESLLMQIGDLVAEAYDIGHAHGMNPMRMALGQKPKWISKGWGLCAYKIRQLILPHLKSQQKGPQNV